MASQPHTRVRSRTVEDVSWTLGGLARFTEVYTFERPGSERGDGGRGPDVLTSGKTSLLVPFPGVKPQSVSWGRVMPARGEPLMKQP